MASPRIREVAKNADGSIMQIAEKTGAQFLVDLKKETDQPVLVGDLSSLTLTLYNLDAALTIINTVNGTSILNTGRGSLDVNGRLTLTLDALDVPLVDATAEKEKHIALIVGTYAAGARIVRKEIEHHVVNLQKVS